MVEKTEVVGDLKGDRIGAERILDDAFHETLLALDDDERTIRYSIDDGPGPVAKDAVRNYRGVVCVLPVTTDDSTYACRSSARRSVGPMLQPCGRLGGQHLPAILRPGQTLPGW